MKVKFLAFGVTRELIGKSDWEAELPAEINLGKVKQMLFDTYPELQEVAALNLAVNESFESDSFEIEPNATIALIPPVSGG